MTGIGAASLLLVLVACAPRTPGTNVESDQSAASKTAITIARTACFGGCPVYSLSVTPSGAVTYEGKAHVRVPGTATAQIARGKVDTLLSELEKAGYFTFASQYVSGEPACGRYATDLPTVITSVTIGGRTKRIEHDYGCRGAPRALVVLERRVDEVLDSGRWTGR
jgi:uncharacterized protein DUF6438